MAITNNGTQNLLADTEVPTAYTRPTVTTFSDEEYESILTLTVLKATVQNAAAATTMTNIFDNASIGINKQITDILAADFLASATITAFGNLTALTNNFADVNRDGDYLTTAAASYICTVTLLVKTS